MDLPLTTQTPHAPTNADLLRYRGVQLLRLVYAIVLIAGLTGVIIHLARGFETSVLILMLMAASLHFLERMILMRRGVSWRAWHSAVIDFAMPAAILAMFGALCMGAAKPWLYFGAPAAWYLAAACYYLRDENREVNVDWHRMAVERFHGVFFVCGAAFYAIATLTGLGAANGWPLVVAMVIIGLGMAIGWLIRLSEIIAELKH